ncbi:MAG: DUF4330 domain-containing protein [Candidatus Omnitrophica bacterium]|nr:DUF4330 domain-containing protein [Candidatus Omnitrophota bacterium]
MRKIIDEKGIVLGKVNIIDLSIILFLICLLPMGYYGYKIFIQKPAANTVKINLEARFCEIMPELADVVHESDIEEDIFGNTIGKLDKILQIKPTESVIFASNEGAFVAFKHPLKHQDMSLRLNLVCTKKNGYLYYKDIPVKIGSPITFSTRLYNISGVITKIENL